MKTAALVDESRQLFQKLFPGSGPVLLAQAPGRVNLIGEHTDYNDGYVLPMAIDKTTVIICRGRRDGVIRLHSAMAGETAEFSITQAVSKDGPKWSLYARGVAEALRGEKIISRGMDAVVATSVPIGGGLSSSASFEVATAMALLAANGTTMPREEMALACQWAEHNYPGMPCGIMDQFISSLGQAGHALLLDCRSRATRQVPLDDADLRVVVCNSNMHHELVQGEYAVRRRQCELAVATLQKNYKIKMLRDVSMNQLQECRHIMETPAFMRARHVISEIERTLDFVAALEKRNYAQCGALMYESHASLRDDYSVSCAELDTLVELARAVPGVYGARMTGGGFGGCMVALTTAAAVGLLEKHIHENYPKLHKKPATIFATVPSAGAQVETLAT